MVFFIILLIFVEVTKVGGSQVNLSDSSSTVCRVICIMRVESFNGMSNHIFTSSLTYVILRVWFTIVDYRTRDREKTRSYVA